MKDSPLIWIAIVIALPFVALGWMALESYLWPPEAPLCDDSPADPDCASKTGPDPFIY